MGFSNFFIGVSYHFFSNSNDDKVYLDGGDGKEGDSDEDNLVFTNYTSCVLQDNIMNHVLEQNECEIIEALQYKMVVISIPHVNSSPCEHINALNIETNLKGIISSSLCQKDEVCDSFTYSFAILYVFLINLCVLVDVSMMELFLKDF